MSEIVVVGLLTCRRWPPHPYAPLERKAVRRQLARSNTQGFRPFILPPKSVLSTRQGIGERARVFTKKASCRPEARNQALSFTEASLGLVHWFFVMMSSQRNHALRADNQINSTYKRATHRWVRFICGCVQVGRVCLYISVCHLVCHVPWEK